ncbi:hypothetical protein [Pseudonocardia zijingensis]|uniref:Immunity protein 50 of polymorphic toxin system n=1 Tax=Pseudonocardia zijingensis TaxID=153376 RepID=A0ABN1PTK1_9PSEU
MSLANVWLQLFDRSLVRADQVTEITLHQTPEIAGKPSRWLLDVAVAVPVGSGDPDGWHTGPLHRTLTQTDRCPSEAPVTLARLLAQLDAVDAAGVVRADSSRVHAAPHPERTAAAGEIHFGFTAFTGTGAPSAPTSIDGAGPGEVRQLSAREPASSSAR